MLYGENTFTWTLRHRRYLASQWSRVAEGSQ